MRGIGCRDKGYHRESCRASAQYDYDELKGEGRIQYAYGCARYPAKAEEVRKDPKGIIRYIEVPCATVINAVTYPEFLGPA